jgi:hypothetical protein
MNITWTLRRGARESLRMDWMRCRLGHVVMALEPMEPGAVPYCVKSPALFRGSGSRNWRHQEGDGALENGMKIAAISGVMSEDDIKLNVFFLSG